jgi:hypothetical protein
VHTKWLVLYMVNKVIAKSEPTHWKPSHFQTQYVSSEKAVFVFHSLPVRMGDVPFHLGRLPCQGDVQLFFPSSVRLLYSSWTMYMNEQHQCGCHLLQVQFAHLEWAQRRVWMRAWLLGEFLCLPVDSVCFCELGPCSDCKFLQSGYCSTFRLYFTNFVQS